MQSAIHTYNNSSQDPMVNKLDVHQQWVEELAHYQSTQITLTNLTESRQTAYLWKTIEASNASATTNQNPVFIDVGNYPQSIAYNPINQKLYVAHQLGGTVWVLDEKGTLETVLQLTPEFVGLASPSFIEVNAVTGSVFIASSIANTITAFSVNLQHLYTITTLNRPFQILSHSANDTLYVAHLNSSDIGLYDTVTGTSTGSITTDLPVKQLLKDDSNWYIRTEAGISKYNELNQNTLSVALPNCVSAVFNANEELIVGKADSLLTLDQHSLSTIKDEPIDLHPDILLHASIASTSYLIVGDKTTRQIRVKNTISNEIRTIQAQTVNVGIAYHPTSNSLYLTHPIDNRLEVISLDNSNDLTAQPTLAFSEDYLEIVEDFKYNPALLKHVKLHLSGDEFYPLIRVGNKSPTGKTEEWSISLENHRHPHTCLRIAELFELEHEMIDSHSEWEITLEPYQRMTLILYYQQFRREHTINNQKNNTKSL